MVRSLLLALLAATTAVVGAGCPVTSEKGGSPVAGFRAGASEERHQPDLTPQLHMGTNATNLFLQQILPSSWHDPLAVQCLLQVLDLRLMLTAYLELQSAWPGSVEELMAVVPWTFRPVARDGSYYSLGATEHDTPGSLSVKLSADLCTVQIHKASADVHSLHPSHSSPVYTITRAELERYAGPPTFRVLNQADSTSAVETRALPVRTPLQVLSRTVAMQIENRLWAYLQREKRFPASLQELMDAQGFAADQSLVTPSGSFANLRSEHAALLVFLDQDRLISRVIYQLPGVTRLISYDKVWDVTHDGKVKSSLAASRAEADSRFQPFVLIRLPVPAGQSEAAAAVEGDPDLTIAPSSRD